MGVRYDTSKGDGATMSDGISAATGAHADYFNAWNEEKFRELVTGCIHAEIACWRNPAKRGV